MKPYCLLLEANNRKYFLSLKNDEEVYGWLDDVYGRSPLMGVSNPTNFVHKVHVGFDPVSGAFTVCFRHFLPDFFLALIVYLLSGHARTMEQAVDEIRHHQGRLCQRSASCPRCPGILHRPSEERVGGYVARYA